MTADLETATPEPDGIDQLDEAEAKCELRITLKDLAAVREELELQTTRVIEREERLEQMFASWEYTKAQLAAAQSRVVSLERELAETRAKRDEYDDGQAHWFNEHFKLRVERDALTAENEKLREALEELKSDEQVTIDQYESNGPQWTTKEGNEYFDASYVVEGARENIAKIDAALHPATKEGKA